MTTGSTLEATTPPDKAAEAVAQPSSSGQHVSIEANAGAMSKTQCLRLAKSDAFKAESSEGESSDEAASRFVCSAKSRSTADSASSQVETF